ncbi:hypothetical protein MRS44_017278 [Fusarium solani]|uniref:uncharacterized protein n=1 Tax=Fusarium solani TaxID=169388 RepID=UPI0032C4A036|nr:hypothetical protein MRS44_017278 [Fusarium solani]
MSTQSIPQDGIRQKNTSKDNGEYEMSGCGRASKTLGLLRREWRKLGYLPREHDLTQDVSRWDLLFEACVQISPPLALGYRLVSAASFYQTYTFIYIGTSRPSQVAGLILLPEELIVYPAFERLIGSKGNKIADIDKQEHHHVKELLKVFQAVKPSDSNYAPKLKEIYSLLSKHIRGEEDCDLPALEQVLQNETGESESMARSFSRTKEFVPSRG